MYRKQKVFNPLIEYFLCVFSIHLCTRFQFIFAVIILSCFLFANDIFKLNYTSYNTLFYITYLFGIYIFLYYNKLIFQHPKSFKNSQMI